MSKSDLASLALAVGLTAAGVTVAIAIVIEETATQFEKRLL